MGSILWPYYRYRNLGKERLNNFPKVTQLVKTKNTKSGFRLRESGFWVCALTVLLQSGRSLLPESRPMIQSLFSPVPALWEMHAQAWNGPGRIVRGLSPICPGGGWPPYLLLHSQKQPQTVTWLEVEWLARHCPCSVELTVFSGRPALKIDYYKTMWYVLKQRVCTRSMRVQRRMWLTSVSGHIWHIRAGSFEEKLIKGLPAKAKPGIRYKAWDLQPPEAITTPKSAGQPSRHMSPLQIPETTHHLQERWYCKNEFCHIAESPNSQFPERYR